MKTIKCAANQHSGTGFKLWSVQAASLADHCTMGIINYFRGICSLKNILVIYVISVKGSENNEHSEFDKLESSWWNIIQRERKRENVR